MKIVIVGGVAAGASAAARARRLDEHAEIIIMEKGEYVSFANCGLPYHVSGDIERRDSLLIVTPQNLREWLDLDVRTLNEVTAIDPERKTVSVTDLGSGEVYEEGYDKLILCQGARAARLDVPGAGDPRVFSLKTIPDMDALIKAIDGGAQSAVVVGANYIGIEAVEALSKRGLSVDLVELQDQVMPALDREMANDLRFHMEEKGVRIHLGTSVSAFGEVDGSLSVELDSGENIAADLAVTAIGVRPESGLASSAGLAVGAGGGVVVDEHMVTSDPDIYAAGDMVQVTDAITGLHAQIPLAGPANRQGRVAANHICGREDRYTATLGSAIVKVFEMTAAITGASEKTLKQAGMEYHKIHLYPFGHAFYYPGTEMMHMKVMISREEGRLLGAQIVGYDGVDKRIDVIATAIHAGLTVHDLEHLELAYAPPYSSAKDPVNMIGFTGVNLLRGDIDFWYPDEYPDLTADGIILDVRTKREYERGHIAGSVNFPLEEMRSRLQDLDDYRDRRVFTYCLTGIRSYYALRLLRQRGFKKVFNLAGSWMTWQSSHRARLDDGTVAVMHTESSAL